MRVLRCMPALCWAGVLLCAGCSNGRGSVGEQQQQQGDTQQGFSVGGSVAGLAGSGLVLQNNGAGNLSVTGNGAFIFSGLLANGAAYNVTVLSQPSSPAQTCTVANGSGSIAGGHIVNIAVTCASNAFPVGGRVTGLTGSGLILQLNGGGDSRSAPMATSRSRRRLHRDRPTTSASEHIRQIHRKHARSRTGRARWAPRL